jgi:hypothetical protein
MAVVRIAQSCTDYKKTLKVQVKATNASGNTTASSNITAAIAKPATPTKGDFNDDCFIDASDVSLFVAHWRLSGGTYPGYDISGPGTGNPADGQIDSYDLNMLVTSYGYRG